MLHIESERWKTYVAPMVMAASILGCGMPGLPSIVGASVVQKTGPLTMDISYGGAILDGQGNELLYGELHCHDTWKCSGWIK